MSACLHVTEDCEVVALLVYVAYRVRNLPTPNSWQLRRNNDIAKILQYFIILLYINVLLSIALPPISLQADSPNAAPIQASSGPLNLSQ
jgi:hypothetical protein